MSAVYVKPRKRVVYDHKPAKQFAASNMVDRILDRSNCGPGRKPVLVEKVDVCMISVDNETGRIVKSFSIGYIGRPIR